jgi:hypothetical protein
MLWKGTGSQFFFPASTIGNITANECTMCADCRLTPYLASLSTSQLKLLTIYYNRAQGKQAEQQSEVQSPA